MAAAGTMASAPETPAPLPAFAPAPSSFEIVYDLTPVTITVTENWQKVRMTVPAEILMSSAPLWRKMHLDDWDRVPVQYRNAALDRMIKGYGCAAQGPATWDRMRAADWDAVPQPIRALAFIRMARERARDIGEGSAVPRELLADTLGAIIATESWFEHRAVNVNPAGDRDLGIGQSSAFCRRVLRRRTAAGIIDCSYGDDDYANPWIASHAAAVWFGLMLDEANGDVDLAVRAYHRGIGQARCGAAEAYLSRVNRHRRWIDGSYSGSPTWRYVTQSTVATLAGPAAHRLPGIPPQASQDARSGATSPSPTPAGDSGATARPRRSR